MNTVTVGVPILLSAILLPLSLIASHHYKAAIDIFSSMDRQLHSQAILYDSGILPFSVASLESTFALEPRMVQQIFAFGTYFRWVFATIFGFGVVLLFVSKRHQNSVHRVSTEIDPCIWSQ